MKNIDNNFIEAFAAQYWGQRVGIRNDTEQRYKVNASTIYELRSIELRSIESLTNEEVKRVHKLEETFYQAIKADLFIENLYSKTIDYLRSIGIAVPFRGVSVEQMIESGKLKIK